MGTDTHSTISESQLKTPAQPVDVTDGTIQLLDETGAIRKIPIPTNDPDDPLTWHLWTRCLVFTIICIYGISGFGVVQSTPLFFGDVIAEYMTQTRGTFNPVRISELASYPSLCMGVGNFLFVPMSLALGRRPVAIICSALMVSSIIWAARSASFNSHLGARCLQGLAAGIADCLLPLIVLDITFLHNRGRWMTLYWAITAIGASLMLVAVPFLVHSQGDNWRINYWFWLGWAVLTFILVLTCLRETMFYREPALLNGQLIISDAYGQVRFEEAQEDHSGSSEPETRPSKKSKTYIEKLLPVSYKSPHSRAHSFLFAYKDMIICLSHPAIFWTLVLNSFLFAGLVILSITYESVLHEAPWHFSAQLIGTAHIGAAVGSIAAFLLTGTLIGKTAEALVRRNKGVREPEHLLPSFALPVVFGCLGLCLYGVVGSHPLKHSWFGIHASFAIYYYSFVALSALSSMWVAELMPKRAGPAIVLICGGRNAASFGLSYSFTPWLADAGFQNVHIAIGCIFLGIALLAIPLYFINKRLRKVWMSFFA